MDSNFVLAPGHRLGPYEIEAAIGSGGMGEVYRARDTRLLRTVAIKVLRPHLAASPEFRARFDGEARAISKLNHPNICTLYDVGEAAGPDAPDGSHVSFLVMELLEGEPLSVRLQRGPLPLDEAVAYSGQIADALDKAHRAGIVHGDLKPGNVMVTRTGVKLLDFGLAVRTAVPPGGGPADAASADTGPVSVPGSGPLLGTLQYLAPEQLEGREPDARSDLFACGALIYEMVTGRKAFEGATQAAVIAAILRQTPPAVSEAQPAAAMLDPLVAGCLVKDPDERWQSAADLARQLKWLATAGPAPAASGAGARHAAPSGARPGQIWKAAVGVLAASTVALATVLFLRAPATETPVLRASVVLPSGLRFPVARTVGGAGRFSISPDGRRIAFIAIDPHGNQMLWVRALDSMAATPLPGTDGASSPFWSPDSQTVAYFTQGQLKTVEAAGSPPVLVASPALDSTGSWNRDDVILFTPSIAAPLHRVPASGGTPSPVTVLDKAAGDVLHRNPFFLPDGRHFLYVAVAAREGGAARPRAVYVGSLDPQEGARLVVDRGSNAMFAQGHVLFMRENTLLAQAFDTDRFVLTGVPTPVAEEIALIGTVSGAFTVSGTGLLAYQPSDTGSRLVWFDREGRQLGMLGDPAEYGDLELSPDGRRAVVSVLDTTLNTRDLWIFDIERGVRTRFTIDPADDVAPVWSPDSTEVIFSSNRQGHFDVYRKSVDGVLGEQLLLADPSEKYPTSWARDGQTAIFWSFSGDGAGLSLLPLSGELRPGRLLNGFANAGRFAPDGRWVAYHSAESGRAEVYVTPYPDASRKWQVSSAGGSLPRWRSDSREIFYAGRDNRLMAVPAEEHDGDLEVGSPRALFDARPVGPRSFYAVSPDGQRFLVNSLQGESLSSSITVVQNWAAALKP